MTERESAAGPRAGGTGPRFSGGDRARPLSLTPVHGGLMRGFGLSDCATEKVCKKTKFRQLVIRRGGAALRGKVSGGLAPWRSGCQSPAVRVHRPSGMLSESLSGRTACDSVWGS